MVAARRVLKDETVAVLQSLVAPLTEALGPGNEVVLHDLRHMEHSVVAIAGDLTNRAVGAPVTDLILQHLQTGNSNDLFRYRTRTKSGRQLRSSTIFARDERGIPFACICINSDITDLLELSKTLVSHLGVDENGSPAELETTNEDFVVSVEDLVVTTVNRAIEEVGVPVGFMRKEHRFEVIKRLDAVGFFLIQDAVVYVATALQVSRFSVYKYLRELSGKESGQEQVGQTRRAGTRPLTMPDEVID